MDHNIIKLITCTARDDHGKYLKPINVKAKCGQQRMLIILLGKTLKELENLD